MRESKCSPHVGLRHVCTLRANPDMLSPALLPPVLLGPALPLWQPAVGVWLFPRHSVLGHLACNAAQAMQQNHHQKRGYAKRRDRKQKKRGKRSGWKQTRRSRTHAHTHTRCEHVAPLRFLRFFCGRASWLALSASAAASLSSAPPPRRPLYMTTTAAAVATNSE